MTGLENRFSIRNIRSDLATEKEKNMKKTLSILLIALVAITGVFANGALEAQTSTKGAQQAQTSGKTEIYFLNFKPEIADVYKNVVKPAFEAENPGYTLKAETAASNQYASTLKSEIAKNNPPVIFQTNGPIGLQGSLDDVADLSNTSFYGLLADKSMALKTPDGMIAAIPYAVEGYGIIYNDAIMQKYFALPGAKASSMDEINSFDKLKAVVEDMQAKKDQLGIKGVFASTSMAPGNDWRWQTHLFNIPLYAEMRDRANGGDATLYGVSATTLLFKYSYRFQQIWDLYLNNSTTARGLLGGKSVDDSMAEFALGQCAMVQNGNWAASQILNVPGNKVANSDIKFMPIYMGIPGEETSGLAIGTENYLCINKNASEAAQKGADVFLTWLFSSETGKKIVNEKLGFITPFNSFGADEMPTDPLAAQIVAWMNKDGVTSIPWTFAAIPSEQWKADFGAALLEYVNYTMNWDAVTKAAQDAWTREAKIAGR